MAKGYKKILIVYRNSPKFLRESFQLAKEEGTWAVVLKPVPTYEGELHLTGIKNLDEILHRYKIKEYKEIKDLAEKEKVLVKIRIEEVEKEEEILDIAIEEKCDLIVIESKKPSLFERFLSLKDRLVELLVTQSPCPVFIIRS